MLYQAAWVRRGGAHVRPTGRYIDSTLGLFATAEEAALVYARNCKPLTRDEEDWIYVLAFPVCE